MLKWAFRYVSIYFYAARIIQCINQTTFFGHFSLSRSLALYVSKIRFVINYLFKIGIQTIRRRMFSIQKMMMGTALFFGLYTMFGWHLRAMNISYASNRRTLFWHIFFAHVLCHQIDFWSCFFDGGINCASQFNYITIIIFDLKYVLINS